MNQEVDANFIDESTVQQVVEQVLRVANDNTLTEDMKEVALTATIEVLKVLGGSVAGHYETLEKLNA